MMVERSELRVRERPHIHPDRRKETICEILRNGVVIATIYGSREGIQIVGADVGKIAPFLTQVETPSGVAQDLVIPLLGEGEVCPWCGGTGAGMTAPLRCPVCGKGTDAVT